MASIYDIDIFDPVESDLESYRNEYTMAPELWQKFQINDLVGVDFSKWKKIKFLNNGDLSSQISRIPTKYGGIYVYCIEPNVIPNVGCYIMYIGMASKTPSENLRQRVRSYKKQVGADYTRNRLHRLFSKWGDYVYVHYLPVDATKDVIVALEDRLIGAFGKPPCNAEVRSRSVKDAVGAFN